MKEPKTFHYKKLLFLNEKEKELLVEIIPFLVIISAIIRLLAVKDDSNFFSEYSSFSLSIGLGIALLIFALFLFFGLFKKKKYGLILMYIFQSILLIYDILIGNILTGILTSLIGIGILIQVKDEYS